MPAKKKKTSATQLDSLQWALRKRGIRPSGNVQQMEKKLANVKLEEERQRIMQQNAKNKKASTASNANGSEHGKSNGGVGARNRNRSGSMSAADVEDRIQVTLWRRPFQTLHYFFREIPCSLGDAWKRFVYSLYDSKRKVIPNSRKLLIFAVIIGILYGLHFIVCKDDEQSRKTKDQMYWYGYWVFLGILSSVGLGTGLHTFVLYLGPFIAKVALAAQECGTLDFQTPPYPDIVMCPEEEVTRGGTVSVYAIIAKVRWESLMWGFGTALGELPPFFMARAARVSGMVEDEDLEKFTELLQQKKRADPKSLSWIERGKLFMEDLVEKVGFWGILACASIPNPLFDLAGITCGHFLVPFTTFFGATVIGKAIVKAHLQMAFVILAFNEELLERVVALIRMVPHYGNRFSDPFVEFMSDQKANLHNKTTSAEPGHLAYILDKVVIGVVVYFVISIINSMAQSYHKRICREKYNCRKSS